MLSRIAISLLLWPSSCWSLRISIDNLSKQFPTNVWRTLTSSVPVREYALKSISLVAESELILLVGASSSGKSTVLQCILQGSTSIALSDPSVQPIYLDRKPDSPTFQKPIRDTITGTNDIDRWNSILELDLSLTFSELSPSQVFKYALLQACCGQCSNNSAPLLLLDEWMDKETSAVVRKVEESLVQMAEQGAIIFCVTHKPELFAKSHRKITLCRGEILSSDEPRRHLT